ncbi:hypothetical protein, partial [Gracilibacillus boraciitolerans]|uniref:hypothetical protein n=1 Tax=Gracilibacillus boraciitolerans TaxID=307521 RepID=UPI001F1CCF7E
MLTLLYFLLIILLQCLFIFRSYKIEKYTLEEIAALDNSFILSNGNENMMFLGIPIALSMPLITLYVSEQISWLPSVFIFSYIFIL